jgi:hypothetical protein
MKKKLLQLLCGKVLLLILAAALHAPQASAQKIQSEKVWTTFHKTPALNLKPQYASYTVEYDLGGLLMSAPPRPALQGLAYEKKDGDLTLLITTKNLYVTKKTFNEYKILGYSCRYTAEYAVEAGYELRDAKTDKVLAVYRKTSGEVSTPTFGSAADLNAYMANAFTGMQIQQLLGQMSRHADFTLNAHDFEAGLTLNSVDGPAPAYASINKAATDLKALLGATAAKTPPARTQVLALAAVWTEQLARVNWTDKKSEINKKTANALLENLCGSALLIEDYAKLNEYVTEFAKHNTGLFGALPLCFEADVSYGGTSPDARIASTATAATASTAQNRETHHVTVWYNDLVADLAPPK